MLQKIISGGQTGADSAALDVAIEFNIPHGGWIPKGRKTEDGTFSMQITAPAKKRHLSGCLTARWTL